MLTKEELYRLTSKLIVLDTGCWEYQGGCNRDGYGYFWLRGETVYAHRAMAYHHGVLSSPKDPLKDIRHSCDYPKCCNPDHLLAGSALSNAKDRDIRNRGAKGEKASKAKLTEPQVLEILKSVRSLGLTHKAAADKYGVSKRAVTMIVTGQSWNEVTGLPKIRLDSQRLYHRRTKAVNTASRSKKGGSICG